MQFKPRALPTIATNPNPTGTLAPFQHKRDRRSSLWGYPRGEVSGTLFAIRNCNPDSDEVPLERRIARSRPGNPFAIARGFGPSMPIDAGHF